MPTPEEKARKAKLASAKSKVRELLMASKDAKAEEWAAAQGFTVMEARLAPEYKNPAEPYFVAYEAKLAELSRLRGLSLPHPKDEPETVSVAAAPQVIEFIEGMPDAADAGLIRSSTVIVSENMWDATPPVSIKGWPIETPAVIWGFCPNKAMVIIELPDKRKASMWKGRGNAWRIYEKCRVKLESAEADPIYAPLPVPRKAF